MIERLRSIGRMTGFRHLSAHLVSGTGEKFKIACCGTDTGSKALQEEKKTQKKGTKKIPLIDPEKKNRKRNGDMGD